MVQESTFKINLTEIEGEEDISCPSCGTVISPEDDSEKAYEITEIISREDGSMEEIIVNCKKCKSIIHLKGFDLLDEVKEFEDSKKEDD